MEARDFSSSLRSTSFPAVALYPIVRPSISTSCSVSTSTSRASSSPADFDAALSSPAAGVSCASTNDPHDPGPQHMTARIAHSHGCDRLTQAFNIQHLRYLAPDTVNPPCSPLDTGGFASSFGKTRDDFQNQPCFQHSGLPRQPPSTTHSGPATLPSALGSPHGPEPRSRPHRPGHIFPVTETECFP